jgi:hypothetical protein
MGVVDKVSHADGEFAKQRKPLKSAYPFDSKAIIDQTKSPESAVSGLFWELLGVRECLVPGTPWNFRSS